MRLSWVTLPVGFGLAIASCATIGGYACSPPQSQVSSSQFASAYAQALCTSLQGCCEENGIRETFSSCTKGWSGAISKLLAGPESNGNYDPAAATNCINQVRAAAGQSCQPVSGSLSAARTACEAVFAGTLPLGAPCTSGMQCAPVDGSLVRCAVVPGDAEAGGGMLPLSFGVSPDGLSVSPDDVPVCVAEAPPDEDAGATPCVIEPDAGFDTCIANGGFCDGDAMTCLPLATSGGPCDPAVVASCAPGNYCLASGALKGTCATALPIGSPCAAAVMCDSTGTCDMAGSHTCVPIKQPGASCSAGNQCSIGVCDATTHRCLTNAIATSAACNGQVSMP